MSLDILELDGGGQKGAIVLAQLKLLESNLPAGKRISDVFPLIFGQSVGAIDGSALACGANVDELIEMHVVEGPHIFTAQNSWWKPWRKITRPLYDRNRVLEPLGSIFKKYNVSKMGDLKTNFVATTVNVCAKPVAQNVFLKSWKRSDRLLTEEVAKSFAAAYYFDYYWDEIDQTYYEDGGTGTMNCTLNHALIEAVTTFGEKAKEGIRIFSFGCGYSENTKTIKEVKNYNNLNQVYDVLFVDGEGLAHAQSTFDQVNGITHLMHHFGVNKIELRRFDMPIPKNINVIDGAKYTQQYLDIGHEYGLQNIDRLKI